MNLFSPSHLQQFIDFITPHSLEQLNSLLRSIGLISTGIGTTAIGAVQAIKFLKGKPKSVEEVGPGAYRYTSQDDNSITVDGNVHTLLSNASITQNIYQIYGPPMLDAPSIDDVKTYVEGDEAAAVVVKRDEIPIIKEFAMPSPTPADAAEKVKETMHYGVFLNPKRGAFGNDPKDWSFWRDDEIITATIKDNHFLNEYANGDVRLNESDLLTVDLLERQKVRGTKVLKPSYEIVKVTDYQRGDSQAKLV